MWYNFKFIYKKNFIKVYYIVMIVNKHSKFKLKLFFFEELITF